MANLGWRRTFKAPWNKGDPLIPHNQYWRRKVTAFVECLRVLNKEEPTSEERAQIQLAFESIEQVLGLVPDHPKALFMRGVLRYWSGEDEQLVREDLEAAGDADRAPRRGSRYINGLIEEVASRHPGTFLFDADRICRERNPMQLVGWEWMLDNCHLGYGARFQVMRDLGAAMLEHWGEKP